jgi:hypothetical protein
MKASKAIWLFVAVASFCAGGFSSVMLLGAVMGDPIPEPKWKHDQAVAASANAARLAMLLGCICTVLLVYSLVKLVAPAKPLPKVPD